MPPKDKSLIDSTQSFADRTSPDLKVDTDQQLFNIFSQSIPAPQQPAASPDSSAQGVPRERLFDAADFQRPGFAFGTAKAPDISQTRTRPRPEVNLPVPDFLRKAAKASGVSLPAKATQSDLSNMIEFVKLNQEKKRLEIESKKTILNNTNLTKTINDISSAVEARIKNDLSSASNIAMSVDKINELRKQYTLEESSRYEAVIPGIASTVSKPPPTMDSPSVGMTRVTFPMSANLPEYLRGKTFDMPSEKLPKAMALGAVPK